MVCPKCILCRCTYTVWLAKFSTTQYQTKESNYGENIPQGCLLGYNIMRSVLHGKWKENFTKKISQIPNHRGMMYNKMYIINFKTNQGVGIV